MLPDLPKHLLPREDEVGKVREKLLGTGTAAVAITAPIRTALAVRGMGGAGKSVLANAVARDKSVRKHFKDGIFWITVGQEGSGTESKAKILQAGLAKRLRATLDADTVQEGKQQIRELLASKACLIILDDVWETADAQHLDVVGPDPSSRILITTREGKVATDLDAEEIALGKLSKDQAIALLSTWCSPAVATDPDALTVIKECGYLPLALAICGARAREGAAWKQIAAGLKRADLSSLKRRGLDPAYDSVLSSIAASVDYMEQTEPELARRYRDLAVFPSDEPIPESVVALLWAQTTGCPEDQAGMDLVELQTKSLLTLEGTYPNRHVSLHDLQHDYVKGTHADLKDAHRKLLQGYHDRCNGVWANQEDDSYFFQHLSDHLRAAGREEEARSLLLDCSWLQAKLQATGILPLIADYEPFAANEAMQLIRWALRLSAPNLARDPSRLRSQLHGRLLGIDLADIKRLLGSVPVQPPWLRPLTPSLSRPGGVLLQTLEGLADTIEAVAISPDGRRIISASSSDNGALRVWDLGTGAEVRTLKGHSDSVNALAVDINGRRLISTSHDETLKVWDLETGGEVRTLVGPYDGVRALALSPDGWRAVSASHDGTLSFWDLETGGEVRTLKGPLCDCVIAVTPDGLVISEWCDGGHPLGLMSWHPDAGAEVHTLVGDDSYLGAVAVTHDGRRAVSGSHDGRLTLWDLNSGEKICTIAGHDDLIRAVAVTQHGQRVLSASHDLSLKLWDLDSSELIRTPEGHGGAVHAVALNPDGQRAVSLSDDRTLIWELEKGKAIRALKGTVDFRAVAATHIGLRAVSNSVGRLTLWDLETGKAVRILEEHADEVCALGLTADGRRAALAFVQYIPTMDMTIHACFIGTWDLETGETIRTLRVGSDIESSVAVALTPDGRRAVAGSIDGSLTFWDLETGSAIRKLGGKENANAVAVTPDGHRVLSASQGRTLRLWDVESGTAIRTLEEHAGAVRSVALTPDGRRCVSVSYDRTLRIWDLESGETLATFVADYPLLSCTVSPDGKTIVAGDSGGRVHFLRWEGA